MRAFREGGKEPMNEEALQRLEYGKVKEKLMSYAVNYMGKKHIENLQPITNVKLIRRQLAEAAEAKSLIQYGASVPLPSLDGIEHVMNLLHTGYVYSEHDFGHLYQFLHSCSQLMKYMRTKEGIAPQVSSYASSMYELSSLKSEIDRCIRNGRVTDLANKELTKVRKKIAVVQERLKSRLDGLMRKHRSILQEYILSSRQGRYVLPVKKEHRKLIKGTVLDESASGQTVYIEPEDVMMLQHELGHLTAEEGRLEAKVLSDLTTLTEQNAQEIRLNIDAVGAYDFIFAKAKYALVIEGTTVEINTGGIMDISEARHPLLERMVPLKFSIGREYKSLIITGPNTGGKTIALKTVGLLTIMVQSGLLVPVAEGSQFAVFTEVAVDIGDGQSIEQALSTFSAHIRNIKRILQIAGHETLVLIDEMATGTDPGEGVGLSIAILEQLHAVGATVVATTHFTEIKNFASMTTGFQNARMEFNPETLQPTYRLIIGEAGQSYALFIALKLGIPEYIIDRSREISKHGMAEANGQQIVQSNMVLQDKSAKDTRQSRQGAVADQEFEPATNEETDVATPLELKHGDRVYIAYLDKYGFVYETEDARGNVGIMIQKNKLKIHKKRLKLSISSTDLYPENYDLDIVFETKENRKKRKLMSRKHVPGITIEIEEEDKQ